MPIHNLGYRRWTGRLESSMSRWSVVAGIGIRRAWQSSWLRRVVFFAWVPAAAMGFMIFLFERSAEDGGASPEFFRGLSRLLLAQRGPTDMVQELIQSAQSSTTPETLAQSRHQFWTTLMLSLFQRSQAFIMIPIIGLIAPPLISQDVRSRAFLLYFSRPLTQFQYLLGKLATILLYTTLVTLVPGLLLYTVGVLLSPGIGIVMHTWDIPLRVFAASAVITIPSAILALTFSSLTTESRYASFAWFAIWIFGYATHGALMAFSSSDTSVVLQSLSLFHLFRDLTGWILDVNTGVEDIQTRLSMLFALTGISLAILVRRISAPMKV
ncbi:MAG: hypothetical protein KDA91_09805 [Planctomycetaceae bacterium]|nr:hypothetical protein [Planctomycetaceae bacterium]